MHRAVPFAILLLAFALRAAALDSIPPGWRDDEVIETTVHAQRVIDGKRPLYFIEAEGHEPLYHYLSAAWIALVGNSLFSVRMVSVFFGLLTVAAAYRLARQLFGRRVALFAALLLAVSFWALMYSRFKIRHISELPFALLAFSFLVGAVCHRDDGRGWKPLLRGFVAGIFLALALYTYFAALTLPIIVLGYGLYLLLTRRAWQPAIIAVVVAFFIYLPLGLTIFSGAERIGVVGGPLAALRNGDLRPALENTVGTLTMFGKTGDPEALYNISGRPVFGVIGFYFFVGGVILSLLHWRDPRYAFLIIWLVGGLAPGFLSTPAASFGHTITVMPVAYILAALPVFLLSPLRTRSVQREELFVNSVFSVNSVVNLALGTLLFAGTAARDLPDYFLRWPAEPSVRYLYKADLHTLARTLRDKPSATYVLNGTLSVWDRRAFALEGVRFASPPRWVNAEWAIIFPSEPAQYLFELHDWQKNVPVSQLQSAPTTFSNGLILEEWDQRGADVIAHWRVGAGYSAVEPPIGASVASPPFPQIAFLHLLAADGSFVAGSDRFDVDAFSLQPGDRYLQRHHFDAPPGTYMLEIGLYNPATGERVLTEEGRDAVMLGAITLP